MIEDLEILCPHCDEELLLPSDMEAGDHNYIEACEYCDSDIEYRFTSIGDEILNCQLQCAD